MKGHLLIVDDEEAIRNIIVSFMEKHGYDCDTAADVDIALEKIRRQEYDIIITDKRIPGGTNDEGGIAVVRFVRENSPSTAVIVMTGYASIESAVSSMKLGAFDYIIKPFEIDTLKQKIDRIRDYQNFLNPESILDMYRMLHDQILDALDSECITGTEQQHMFLQSFNDKIDFVFHTIKHWENIIFDQRERLTNIAFFAEQLRDTVSDTDPAHQIVESIWNEARRRL